MTLQKLYDHISENAKRTENAISQMDSKFDKFTSHLLKVEDRVESIKKNFKESDLHVKQCEEKIEQGLLLAKSVMRENRSLKRQLELAENQLRGPSLHILG
nr:PREDICTED: uncharacterized protein LOC106702584 [Latimeria chalumnae]|eukprot:XP_014340806.1 PREDICTED: uncharacterized protein LOC106702584 [Latimeria chalumnae]